MSGLLEQGSGGEVSSPRAHFARKITFTANRPGHNAPPLVARRQSLVGEGPAHGPSEKKLVVSSGFISLKHRQILISF